MSEQPPIAGMDPGEVLSFVNRYREQHGWPPSRREIASEFKVSPSSVQLLLKEMIEQGLIQVAPGGARSINITGAGMKMVTRSM